MKNNIKDEDTNAWSVDCNQADKLIPDSLYNLLAFILNENKATSDIDKETGRVKLQDSLENKAGSRLTMNERVLHLAQDIAFAKTSIRTPQHLII